MAAEKTPATIEAVLAGLRNGLAHKHAAARAGVGESTWNRWRRENPELQEDAAAAIAFFVESQHTKVVSGPHADPKWLLERRAPEEYGKRDKVIHEIILDMPSLLPPGAATVDWKALQRKADDGTLRPEDVQAALPVLADNGDAPRTGHDQPDPVAADDG